MTETSNYDTSLYFVPKEGEVPKNHKNPKLIVTIRPPLGPTTINLHFLSQSVMKKSSCEYLKPSPTFMNEK